MLKLPPNNEAWWQPSQLDSGFASPRRWMTDAHTYRGHFRKSGGVDPALTHSVFATRREVLCLLALR
ncbi:hypothetical protein GW17_00015076 [Ensete ventricosum]|nr:hypothetical protein GW17_00015076 [Ensete ventricosum]